MKLTWFGHAFFLMESEAKTRIATDPYDPPTGYPLPALSADVVTLSHRHHDHAYAECVKGAKVIDRSEGAQTVADVVITAFPCFHDEQRGALRGKNTIYVFEIDGLRVAHLGDLGHTLTAEFIAMMGPIDILLLPVGGIYTIDAAGAAQTAKALGAACVVPMHYMTKHVSFELGMVDPFLALMDKPILRTGNTVELFKGNLIRGVMVMEY